MKTEKKVPAECVLFKEWFDNQSYSQRAGIKKLIADKCDKTLEGIDNWLYGRSAPNKGYQVLINEAAQEKIFNV